MIINANNGFKTDETERECFLKIYGMCNLSKVVLNPLFASLIK